MTTTDTAMSGCNTANVPAGVLEACALLGYVMTIGIARDSGGKSRGFYARLDHDTDTLTVYVEGFHLDAVIADAAMQIIQNTAHPTEFEKVRGSFERVFRIPWVNRMQR